MVQREDRLDEESSGFTARSKAHGTVWYSKCLAEYALVFMFARLESRRTPSRNVVWSTLGSITRGSVDGRLVSKSYNTGGATVEDTDARYSEAVSTSQ